MGDKIQDVSMDHVRAMFERSGMSLHALGIAMGYDAATARQSAFQFMKSHDPRISMLRRFAKALDVPLADLLDKKKGQSN
jgi:transcriptional regulator with XRE-family HTH domain